MSTPQPGWYPDPQDPTKRIRFWDGTQWTAQNRPDPFYSPAASTDDPRRRIWFARHKVLTAVLATILVFVFAGIAAGGEDEPASTAGDSSSGDDADPSNEAEPSEAKSESAAREETPKTASRKPQRTYLVVRVVDGDTLDLGNGQTVRLVGIDSPEVGECGYEPASKNLARLVLGQQVRLAESDEDTDRYGRLLRYVDVGTIDAGLRQIQQGFAIARYDSRDGYGFHPREPIYIKADKAKSQFTCARPFAQPSQPANDCITGYSPCLPVVGDLDCADINGPVRVTGSDPYRLDADGDGTGCDS
jgi:endonuclease YncB( thermonuclease family)